MRLRDIIESWNANKYESWSDIRPSPVVHVHGRTVTHAEDHVLKVYRLKVLAGDEGTYESCGNDRVGEIHGC